MKRRVKVSAIFLLLALVIGFAVKFGFEGRSVSPPPVRLSLSGRQTDLDSQMVFDVVNKGPRAIVCVDYWQLEFSDGSFTELSLPSAGYLRVDSGTTGRVAIPKPLAPGRWRLRAGYFEEDLEFQVKTKINQSPIKELAPSKARNLQGKFAVSDWLE